MKCLKHFISSRSNIPYSLDNTTDSTYYGATLMEVIIIIVALILSIVLHEMAHGYAANWLGDPTARLAGRLSGNPLVHLDPLGSVIIPAILFFSNAGIIFGWAKPVPHRQES